MDYSKTEVKPTRGGLDTTTSPAPDPADEPDQNDWDDAESEETEDRPYSDPGEEEEHPGRDEPS